MVSYALARVFVMVCPLVFWNESTRVVTNGFEGTQAYIWALGPFVGLAQRGEGCSTHKVRKACLDYRYFLNPAFTASKAQIRRKQACCSGLSFHL